MGYKDSKEINIVILYDVSNNNLVYVDNNILIFYKYYQVRYNELNKWYLYLCAK